MQVLWRKKASKLSVFLILKFINIKLHHTTYQYASMVNMYSILHLCNSREREKEIYEIQVV